MFKKAGASLFVILLSAMSVTAYGENPSLFYGSTAKMNNVSDNSASDFNQMLIYVYQQNPRLQSARQSLKLQDEHVSEAVSGFRPSLTANGDLGRQRESIGSENWLYGTARDTSLVLSQPLFNGFGTFAQFHAARARVSAERSRLISVEEQVLLDSITAYLEVVTKQYILYFNRDNRNHLHAYVEVTEKRVTAGDGTTTDLAQAESRLAQADTNVATSEANWQAARATYNRVTGLAVSSSEFPPFPNSLPVRAEEAEVLAKSAPEWHEAAEQERAASHDIDAASSALWPTVSLRGSMSSQYSPDLGLQNLRDDTITVNVSIPLYQGGADYARIRESKELHEKTHDDLIDTSRFVTERASQTWYNYQASLRVIAASRITVEAAMRALKGLETEQQQGMRTLTDVLDARAEFQNALITEIEAEENARLQAYRLLAATGQLTVSHLQLATPVYDPKRHYDKVADAWTGLK